VLFGVIGVGVRRFVGLCTKERRVKCSHE